MGTKNSNDMSKTPHAVALGRITHEPSDKDAWKCICGNYPGGDGFYPCDAHGNEVEPTREAWTTGLYVCAQCGRIINPDTLEVVGQQHDK